MSLGREEYYACIDRCFWSERDSMSLSAKAGARSHGYSGRFGCLGGVGDGGDIMKTIAPQMTQILSRYRFDSLTLHTRSLRL